MAAMVINMAAMVITVKTSLTFSMAAQHHIEYLVNLPLHQGHMATVRQFSCIWFSGTNDITVNCA